MTPRLLNSSRVSLAIAEADDEPEVRAKYRPFLLPSGASHKDWVAQLELSGVEALAHQSISSVPSTRLRVLVLQGSIRDGSVSSLLALECARILFRLGCDVRVFDPSGLPLKDTVTDQHPTVQELRQLCGWSDGHVWVSPEQHGNMTAVLKNQIDWIPVNSGAIRPTQGRILAILQVTGGSQSFNTINTLRLLGRSLRMFTIPSQTSVPSAYKHFSNAQEKSAGEDIGNRMMPSSYRDRVVDCMEEFVKYSLILRPHFELFYDRYSERKELIEVGSSEPLLPQPTAVRSQTTTTT